MSSIIFSDWVRSAIGKNLLSVNGLFHVYEGKRDPRPQEICFAFDGIVPVKFYGASDCASIEMSVLSLVEHDMSEFGLLSVYDISEEAGFADFIGCKLVSVFAITSTVQNKNIGIQLCFGGGRVSLLNLGDELFVFDSISEQIVADEGISFFLIDGDECL